MLPTAVRLNMFKPTRQLMAFKPTRKMMAVPKEEQSAHTISQRLRRIKDVPSELWPLGLVVAVAVGAAGYSLIRKLYVDKTMRLNRQNRRD